MACFTPCGPQRVTQATGWPIAYDLQHMIYGTAVHVPYNVACGARPIAGMWVHLVYAVAYAMERDVDLVVLMILHYAFDWLSNF